MLVDLNIETNFTYLKLFKNIIIKKLKLILTIKTLFEKL